MATDEYGGEPKGPIAYMANNTIAATLLTLLILVVGFVSLTGLEREAWPTFAYNVIEISVPYPGATPDEIEESVALKIEEHVEALEFVRRVSTTAAPGFASVRLEVKSNTDMAEAINDIESQLSQIRNLPIGAEKPRVHEMNSYQSIIRLVLYGDIPERSLKELAYEVEDQLSNLPTVSRVETSGVRPYEIGIEISQGKLHELGLTVTDIANAIRLNTLDLSAGEIQDQDRQIRVRTIGKRHNQVEFEDVIVLSRPDGAEVRLGDIAQIQDGFQDIDLVVRHTGLPAVFVEVYRVEGENVMEVASAIHDHVYSVVEPSLPEGVGIQIWNDESQTYSERVYLLVKNGLLGLLLVGIAITFFLDLRLAFWVMAGLVVTFVGVLAIMLFFDVSISTISLFVFVLAIGIVVDDAIVVAEQVHLEQASGISPVAAAIRGARRVRVPLTFAVLTSIVAFFPLFFIPGGIGEIWQPLPIMVIGILVISLIESFFILPNHLSHVRSRDNSAIVQQVFDRIHAIVDKRLKQFTDGPLDRYVRFATTYPVVVISASIGALVLSISLLAAGLIPTVFADIVEGDYVTASLEMPFGTTADRTYEVARQIEDAGRAVIEQIEQESGFNGASLLAGSMITVGRRPRIEGGGVVAQPTVNPESNIATIDFKLVSAQHRDISTVALADAWRKHVGSLPYVRSVTFSGEVLNLGAAVETVLSHPDPSQLIEIATTVVNELRGIEGVLDIRSNHTPGVKEIQLSLLPAANSLGIDVAQLANQIRSAFYGEEVVRVQRGKEDVKVFVRLPTSERDAISDVERYLLQTPDGTDVPLMQIATVTLGNSLPSIQRVDGHRVVTITADVDAMAISNTEANSILADSILSRLQDQYPDLTYTYGGTQQEQIETLGTLFRGFAIAMVLIYGLLAIALRSFSRPLVVMSIVPFGIIGVLLGHLILGVPFGATAIMGILGLSGVIVNDSLVMMDFISVRISEGMSIQEAIVDGAKRRFRPIFLTSITTFLGFTPLILEPSIQAQFLLPFAAALGIGLLITTIILMVLVPAVATLNLNLSARYGSLARAAAETN